MKKFITQTNIIGKPEVDDIKKYNAFFAFGSTNFTKGVGIIKQRIINSKYHQSFKSNSFSKIGSGLTYQIL